MEIVAKLRQREVLILEGASEVTLYRWWQEFGRLTTEQIKRNHMSGPGLRRGAHP